MISIPAADRHAGHAARRSLVALCWLGLVGLVAGLLPVQGAWADDVRWSSLAVEQALLDEVDALPWARVDTIGHSVLGRPIPMVRFGAAAAEGPLAHTGIAFVGALHGSEPAGREALLRFVERLMTTQDPGELGFIEEHGLVVIPNANPDGIVDSSRRNANGVDLNRDMMGLTQPETRALTVALGEVDPVLVVDLHEFYRIDLDSNQVEVAHGAPMAAHPSVRDDTAALRDLLIGDAQAAGWRAGVWGSTTSEGEVPRLRASSALRHAMSILVESHRMQDLPAAEADRVAVQTLAVERTFAHAIAGTAQRIVAREAAISDKIAEGADGTAAFHLSHDRLIDPPPLAYRLSPEEVAASAVHRQAYRIQLEPTTNLIRMDQFAQPVIPHLFDERSPNHVVAAEPIYELPSGAGVAPRITLNGQPAAPEGLVPQALVGEPISWEIVAVNTGDSHLANVRFQRDADGATLCDEEALLAPGAATSCAVDEHAIPGGDTLSVSVVGTLSQADGEIGEDGSLIEATVQGRYETLDGVEMPASVGAAGSHLAGDWNGDGRVTPGWRIGDRFYLRNASSSGATDVVVRFGRVSDVPVVGDWNGDGVTTVGVRRGDRWLLRNSNTAGGADHDFSFGRASDAVGVVGDWNGDGRTTVGFWRPGGFWSLRNHHSAGWGNYRFTFGMASDARPVVGDWNGDGRTTVGFWRPGGFWSLRNHHSAGWGDYRFTFGRADDARPVVGDWNGDGRTTVGAVTEGDLWILRNRHAAGLRDIGFRYAPVPGVPISGDWNGDGAATPGWRVGEFFHLHAATASGADVTLRFGAGGDEVPVAGDWNGDGRDTIGVWRPGGRWHLRTSHATGAAEHRFFFGRQDQDVPVVGDWNNDGRDTVGVRRGDEWVLRDSLSAGGADHRFRFGRQPGDEGFTGDWNGDGYTTVGIRRGDEWLLRNSLTAGGADHRFRFGRHAAAVGVAGDWNGDDRDTVGFLHDTSWRLRNRHAAGTADASYMDPM